MPQNTNVKLRFLPGETHETDQLLADVLDAQGRVTTTMAVQAVTVADSVAPEPQGANPASSQPPPPAQPEQPAQPADQPTVPIS